MPNLHSYQQSGSFTHFFIRFFVVQAGLLFRKSKILLRNYYQILPTTLFTIHPPHRSPDHRIHTFSSQKSQQHRTFKMIFLYNLMIFKELIYL